jgi:hypothetical protein
MKQKIDNVEWNVDTSTGEITEPQKRVIKVQFDIEYTPTRYSISDKDNIKEVVPDLSISVKQLLEQHSRGGIDQNLVKQPLYFETQIPTIQDMTDVEAYQEMLQERLKEVNNFIALDKKNALEAQEKAANEAAKQREDSKVLDIDPATGQTRIPSE